MRPIQQPDGARSDRRRERGQSVIELAISVPVVMLLLLGMLEFGFIFTHHLGLEYASREAARMGAALGSGTDQVVCADVDKNVIAALQRVITSPGSQIKVGNVTQIKIFSADVNGAQIGSLVNTWVPGSDGTLVDGKPLIWKVASTGWNACSRRNSWTAGPPAVAPDLVGVSLTYNYQLVTPLGNFVSAFGSGTLTISDKTVMAVNPT